MFDTRSLSWYLPWATLIAPGLELPPRSWPGEQAGVTAHAVAGIDAGVPVIAGTIDAWSEALSVGILQLGPTSPVRTDPSSPTPDKPG